MMLALPDEVGVNFVTENRDMVLLADAAERQQSSRLQTRPTGLWGLHSRNSLT